MQTDILPINPPEPVTSRRGTSPVSITVVIMLTVPRTSRPATLMLPTILPQPPPPPTVPALTRMIFTPLRALLPVVPGPQTARLDTRMRAAHPVRTHRVPGAVAAALGLPAAVVRAAVLGGHPVGADVGELPAAGGVAHAVAVAEARGVVRVAGGARAGGEASRCGAGVRGAVGAAAGGAGGCAIRPDAAVVLAVAEVDVALVDALVLATLLEAVVWRDVLVGSSRRVGNGPVRNWTQNWYSFGS